MPSPVRKTKADSAQPARQARAEDRDPSIPDPLGDDRRVVPAGGLTAGTRDHEGLLGAGSMPRQDGGVAEHPIHDEDGEDMGPNEFEEEFEEARLGGFEPRVNDEPANGVDALGENLDPDEDEEDEDEEDDEDEGDEDEDYDEDEDEDEDEDDDDEEEEDEEEM